jgi:hypothetical protein
MIALWLAACVYRVTLATEPAPVQIALPDGSVVATPAEVSLRWVPFGHQVVTASAPGYRPLTIDLRRTEVRWPHWLRGASRRKVELLLVPDHGPAGTWRPEDVP